MAVAVGRGPWPVGCDMSSCSSCIDSCQSVSVMLSVMSSSAPSIQSVRPSVCLSDRVHVSVSLFARSSLLSVPVCEDLMSALSASHVAAHPRRSLSVRLSASTYLCIYLAIYVPSQTNGLELFRPHLVTRYYSSYLVSYRRVR